jgi:hypothetical protein
MYPGTMKLKKKEFTDLKQGGMTVNEYLNSFIQLSRYATEDINTNKKKQDMFLEGLNDDIQFQLLNTDYTNFQHMVDKAIVIESKLKKMEKDGKRRMPFPEQSSGSNVRPRFSQPNQFFKPPQMNRPQMPMQMQCPQLQMQWPQSQMQRPNSPLQWTLQQMNQQNVQQQPQQNPQSVSHPAAQPIQNAENPGGQGLGPCFKCGMNGHVARQRPNKPSAPGAGGQSWPQGQQNYTYGMVNHMTTKEAQQAQDIVLGMFFTSSHPTTVLFDSGASHSFISSSFVAKHHLPITIMKHTMLVSSPGGEMRINIYVEQLVLP